MRILYIAKHNCGDNDDEGAIGYALEKLGHTVVRVHEKRMHRLLEPTHVPADFCLFHKHEDVDEIRAVSRRMPCYFWYFDLVDNGDPSMAPRAAFRVRWMHAMMPIVKLGFCTDGDWVARGPSNLRWLMQGCDERVAGAGQPLPVVPVPPLLFAGMVNHGQRRVECIRLLLERYGPQFHVLGDGGPRYRVHGRQFADLLASVKVSIAPDGPNSDRYWSNRVYQTLGFAGFLLHPRCRMLDAHYTPDQLVQYEGFEDLCSKVDYYLEHPEERARIRHAGFVRTMLEHTYRHRCVELLKHIGG